MWKILGQEKLVTTLEDSIADERLSHAYLFTGPNHIGKKTLALNLACALNCIAEDKPCCECSSCRRILSGNHPDIQVIQLTESDVDQVARKAIRKEQIEEMQYSINLNPYEGSYRIIIIDGAEYMSTGAANSLLKTLEEPPEHTVIILLAVEQDLLLPTIRSRCRKLKLEPMSTEALRHVLIDHMELSPDKARLIAKFSNGRIGWAISAISDENILEERSINLENLIRLVYTDISERFQFATDLATQFGKNRIVANQQLELWLTWWRDILLLKSDCKDFIINVDRYETIQQQADQYGIETIAYVIRAIRSALQQLDQNINSRLALEVLMLSIPQIQKEAYYA